MEHIHTENAFDSQVFDVRAAGIEKDLNSARAFLRALMEDFQEKRIDGVMGCEMIFTLLAVYSQLLNEFCCWQYYAHHIHHPLFEDWKIILEDAQTPAFKNRVSMFFASEPDYAGIKHPERNAARRILFEGVNQQKARIEACSEAIENLPVESFINIDDLMNRQVTSAIATELLGMKSEELDEMITDKIHEAELVGSENEGVAIPVFTTA